MDRINEAPIKTSGNSLRSLLEELELAVKVGSSSDLESAANSLLATLKMDIYKLAWRQEPYDGLPEVESAYLENIEVSLRQAVPPDSTGVWLFRTCGHCNHQELLGASHGISRKPAQTNVRSVLDILETVRDL